MNKKVLAGLARDAIFFAIGTGVGVAVGYKVASNGFEKEMADEIRKLREMTDQRIARKEEALREEYNLTKAATPETVVINEVVQEPTPEIKPSTGSHTNYHKVASENIISVGNEAPTPSDVATGQYEDEEVHETIPVVVDSSPEPYLITVTQYFDGEWEHHGKSDLDYYPEGDILLEDGNSWVMERETMIPADALQRFGYGSDDEDIVYVRNEKYMMDYAIHRHDEPFNAENL